MPPLGIQLYTLRAQLAENFESVMRRVAEIGYVGVEFGGVYGESPTAAAKLCNELGLQIFSMHAPTPMRDNLTLAIDTARTLDVKRVVCAWYPPENFATRDDIRATCDELNTANEVMRGHALELHYHNHWQECARVGDKFVYQHMLDFLEPTIGFEVDVYWAKTAGLDPAEVVREIGKRAPLLHIKDGPRDDGCGDDCGGRWRCRFFCDFKREPRHGGMVDRGIGSLRDGYAASRRKKLLFHHTTRIRAWKINLVSASLAAATSAKFIARICKRSVI